MKIVHVFFDRKMCQELHDFETVYADRKHNLSGEKRKEPVIQPRNDDAAMT